jgi:hypothetical protein
LTVWGWGAGTAENRGRRERRGRSVVSSIVRDVVGSSDTPGWVWDERRCFEDPRWVGGLVSSGSTVEASRYRSAGRSGDDQGHGQGL